MSHNVSKYPVTPPCSVRGPIYPLQLEVLAQSVEIHYVVSHSPSLGVRHA